MKGHILIAFILVASYTVNAQFTAGIDGGLSIPASDYGGKSLPAPNSPISGNANIGGFAKVGTCFDGYAGFKFIPFFGAMVQYGVNSNSNNIASANNSNTAYNSSGSDKVTEYLIGPFFSIKLIKIKIEAKLLGGLVASNYPTVTESFSGVSTPVINSFQTGNSFGYCAGAKIKYMAAKIFGIGLGLDYVGSDPSFKGTNNLSSQSTTYKMSEGILQATIGLSIDI